MYARSDSGQERTGGRYDEKNVGALRRFLKELQERVLRFMVKPLDSDNERPCFARKRSVVRTFPEPPRILNGKQSIPSHEDVRIPLHRKPELAFDDPKRLGYACLILRLDDGGVMPHTASIPCRCIARLTPVRDVRVWRETHARKGEIMRANALNTLIFCILSLTATIATAHPLKLIIPTHYPFTLEDASQDIALLNRYPSRTQPLDLSIPTTKVVISDQNPALSDRNPYRLQPRILPFRDTLLAELPGGLGYSDSSMHAELVHYVGSGFTVYAVADKPVHPDPFGLVPADTRFGQGRSYRLILAFQFTARW